MGTSAAGKNQKPVIAPELGDDWHADPWYGLLKQTDLINSRPLGNLVEAADLDDKEKYKLRFFARQFIDSMNPGNFAATNPDAIKLALEASGKSVRVGLANLLEDLRRGRSRAM